MSSTAAPTMTTTLSPRDYPRKVRFTFPYNNCTVASTQRNSASVKSQLAGTLNISESTITDFNLTCGSMVVTYTQTHSSSMSAEAAVTLLKQMIEQNRLNITIDNTTLTADSASLTVDIQTPPYATPAGPTKEDDKLSGGAIAGIVIGVLIFVLLIALVFYFLCCRKNAMRKDNQVEPNDNDVELRGTLFVFCFYDTAIGAVV